MTALHPKIDLQDSFEPLSNGDLDVLESKLQATLPCDYRRFLLIHNGALLPNVPVTFQPMTDVGVELPHGEAVKSFLGFQSRNEEFWDVIQESEGLEGNTNPTLFLAVVRTTCNVVWMSLGEAVGEILFFDAIENKWTWITDSFANFVAGLVIRPEHIELVRQQTDLLFQAAEIGDIDTFVTSLGSRRDINIRNATGETPLMISANKRHKSMVEWLLSNGADTNVVDVFGNTPLFDAISGHGFDITRMLIDAGADLNATNQNGLTPLQYAVSIESHRIAKWLAAHCGGKGDRFI